MTQNMRFFALKKKKKKIGQVHIKKKVSYIE